MSDFLLPVTTPLPGTLDVNKVVDQVWEKLRTEEAINDLSLPPRAFSYSIPRALRVIFHLLSAHQTIPDSYTVYNKETKEIESTVCYYRSEIEECPEIIEARLAHEITHGLRLLLVETANNERTHPSQDMWMISTPPKENDDRMFKSANIYMMDDRDGDFHAGYWMQHQLFGGILTTLQGRYFTDLQDPEGTMVNLYQNSSKPRAYFRIRTITKKQRDHDCCAFNELRGELYNQATGTFTESVIYHWSGVRMCFRNLHRGPLPYIYR